MTLNPIFWAKVAMLGGLVAFGATQTVRLHSEQLAHAGTRLAFSDFQTVAARSALAQTLDNERQVSGWRATQKGNADANRQQTDALLELLAASRAAGDGLQHRLNQLATAIRQAPRDPGAQPGSTTAGQAADLLAFMSRRIDQAAEGIGEFAERSHVAGELCVRDYDALTTPRS